MSHVCAYTGRRDYMLPDGYTNRGHMCGWLQVRKGDQQRGELGKARYPAQMKFVVYKDRKKEWRWRLVKNGRVIADSGEGYKRPGRCREMVRKIILGAANATIE